MTHPALSALSRFLEADAMTERDKVQRPLIRKLHRSMAEAFREQGQEFVKGLAVLADRFDQNAEQVSEAAAFRESITASDWLWIFADAAVATLSLFEGPLNEGILAAMLAGGQVLVGQLDLDISFSLDNPRAVAYAEAHAAAQVTRINDTTRDYLNTLITQAVDQGWAWDRVAEMIEERFEEFATGGYRPRSQRVAIYEIGDAYEFGNEQQAGEIAAAGIPMEKAWLTANDEKVRPSHQANQKQGYIPLDDSFSSGDKRPPTDSGCRCATLHRRAR